MRRRRTVFALILAIAAIGLVALMMSGGSSLSSSPSSTSDTPEQELDGGHERGGAAEAEEEANAAAERLDAWKEAKADGTLRVNQAQAQAAAAPAAGWAGEQVVSPTADDWEPAIAADPNSPFVYLLTTRYTGPTACGNKCPLPYIMLKVSSDGGVTWGPRPLHLHVLWRRCTGRPDHRGRPEHGRRLRRVHERLQRDVHEVDRPRHNLVDSREDLRQGQLERQADPGHERQRQRRVRELERSAERRSVRGAIARRRRDVDADEDRQQHPVLLRLRRRRVAQRHGRVLARPASTTAVPAVRWSGRHR